MSAINTLRLNPTLSLNRPSRSQSPAPQESGEPVDSFQPSQELSGRLPGQAPSMIQVFSGKSFLTVSSPTGNLGWGKAIGGGALGLYGAYSGIRETGRGMDLMADGKPVEGGLTATSGVATSVGGVAATLSGFGLGGVGMRCLGPGAFGVAAMADGARDIYAGYQNGDADKAGIGCLKTGAGSLMLTGALSANPVLMGTGAILYAGTWTYENKDAIADALVNSGDTLRSGGARLANAIDSGGQLAVQGIQQTGTTLVAGAAAGAHALLGNGALANAGIDLAQQGGQAVVDGAATLAQGAVSLVEGGTQAVANGAAALADGTVNLAIDAGNAVSKGASALLRGLTGGWWR
ncbi:hypothetical protein JST97_35410 [bacterium]|nr:hypothetical protein [bacterium]